MIFGALLKAGLFLGLEEKRKESRRESGGVADTPQSGNEKDRALERLGPEDRAGLEAKA